MPDQRPTTRICHYDEDRIVIRGHDLVGDLMGKKSFVEVFLLQVLGRTPSPSQVRMVDAVLVTIMEHGLVPSAVATRITHYGAPESVQGAIAAGLLGVGDRYAGTAGECGLMLEKILAAPAADREAAAAALIRDYRSRRVPVPGFGHPIHRRVDPRVNRLIEIARDAGARGEHIEAVNLVERCLEKELQRKLPTNISAAIAAVLGEADVPARIMRGFILTARCAGLVGHLLEEMQDPAAEDMWKAATAAVTSESAEDA